jgi:copper(I)-binding protein
MTKGYVLVMVVAAMALGACGGPGGDLVVSDARIGKPTGPNAALYFTVENQSDVADVLESAGSAVAASVEIHETIAGDDGTMGMQPVDAPLEVIPGARLIFEPGGFHLMLVDVDRLEVGDRVEITLTWKNAGERAIEAEVVEPQDVGGHAGQDG